MPVAPHADGSTDSASASTTITSPTLSAVTLDKISTPTTA